MITVMVIDDHAFVRTALRRLLEDDPNVKVLGEAGTGEEALLMARKIKPDVALLDVDLPDLTGMEIAQRLLQRQDVRHIIVITAFASDIYSRRILRMGVGGLLLKKASRNNCWRLSIVCITANNTSVQKLLSNSP